MQWFQNEHFIFDKDDADDNEEEDDDESTASGSSGGPDFNYILNNPLWCLTKEKKDALLKQRDEKVSELGLLSGGICFNFSQVVPCKKEKMLPMYVITI